MIVEFPNNPIQLDGLPPRCFPLYPVSKTIKQMVCNRDTRKSFMVTAQQWQLPIQLAFSITGHGAQRKTMHCVATDLNSNGPGAYVAASRATRRQDLILTRPVTLHSLNTPLNRDLVREMRHLDALAHNTLVHIGHLNAELMLVPDAELDMRTSTRIAFEVEDDDRSAPHTRSTRTRGVKVDVSGSASKNADALPSMPPCAPHANTMRLRSRGAPLTAYTTNDAASSSPRAEPEHTHTPVRSFVDLWHARLTVIASQPHILWENVRFLQITTLLKIWRWTVACLMFLPAGKHIHK